MKEIIRIIISNVITMKPVFLSFQIFLFFHYADHNLIPEILYIMRNSIKIAKYFMKEKKIYISVDSGSSNYDFSSSPGDDPLGQAWPWTFGAWIRSLGIPRGKRGVWLITRQAARHSRRLTFSLTDFFFLMIYFFLF